MSEECEFELGMPFVLCQSNGGEYDDDAFVSGYRLGTLDANLTIAAAVHALEPEPIVGKPVEFKQIDLIAMKHGFEVEHRMVDDEWAIYTFTRIGCADDE